MTHYPQFKLDIHGRPIKPDHWPVGRPFPPLDYEPLHPPTEASGPSSFAIKGALIGVVVIILIAVVMKFVFHG